MFYPSKFVFSAFFFAMASNSSVSVALNCRGVAENLRRAIVGAVSKPNQSPFPDGDLADGTIFNWTKPGRSFFMRPGRADKVHLIEIPSHNFMPERLRNLNFHSLNAVRSAGTNFDAVSFYPFDTEGFSEQYSWSARAGLIGGHATNGITSFSLSVKSSGPNLSMIHIWYKRTDFYFSLDSRYNTVITTEPKPIPIPYWTVVETYNLKSDGALEIQVRYLAGLTETIKRSIPRPMAPKGFRD